MKVIFLEHVVHVAKAWEVKEVSSGYASNFLFPKKLAKAYSKEIETNIINKKQKEESQRRTLLGEKQEIVDTLSGEILEFFLASSGSKPQGSINPRDVAEYISKKYKIPLTKKYIDFWGVYSTLKYFGDHDIYVDMWENIATKIIVRISQKV